MKPVVELSIVRRRSGRSSSSKTLLLTILGRDFLEVIGKHVAAQERQVSVQGRLECGILDRNIVAHRVALGTEEQEKAIVSLHQEKANYPAGPQPGGCVALH